MNATILVTGGTGRLGRLVVPPLREAGRDVRILGRRPRAPAGYLVRAAAKAGVDHLAHISVIAADTLPLAWFRTRAAAEREVMEAGIPWTVLRAAQFVEALRGVPGKAGRAYRAGENLNFDAERGAGSWADPAAA